MITVLVGNDADSGFDFLFAGNAVFLHPAQNILHVSVVQGLAGAGPAHRLYNVDVVQPNAIPALVSGELVGVRPLHLAAQDRSVA